jgi:hypothetical protein
VVRAKTSLRKAKEAMLSLLPVVLKLVSPAAVRPPLSPSKKNQSF